MTSNTRADLLKDLSVPNTVTILFFDSKTSTVCRSVEKALQKMVNRINSEFLALRTVNGDDQMMQDVLGISELPVVIVTNDCEEVREFYGNGSAQELAEIKDTIMPLI